MASTPKPLLFDIPMDEIAPQDPWVASMLQASTIPDVIGELTSRAILTSDETIDLQFVLDKSGSLENFVDAIIAGMESTDTKQPGFYEELRKVAKVERAKFRMALHLYDTHVRQLFPLTRLFIDDPDPARAGKDMRNPAATKINKVNYRPSGRTNTIMAMKQALADALMYNGVMQSPDFEQPVKHVLAGMGDGLCNEGTLAELVEFRQTVLRLRKSESWTFLFFFIADADTVKQFRDGMVNVDAQWYIQQLIETRGLEDDTEPNPITGDTYTAVDKAWAQLMFEVMGTGWGAYTADKSAVAKLPGENGKIARLYLAGEKVIENMMGDYTAQGGFAFPAANVSTIFFDPMQIAHMLGTKVSSSVIRSVALNVGAPQVAPADDQPTTTSAPTSSW